MTTSPQIIYKPVTSWWKNQLKKALLPRHKQQNPNVRKQHCRALYPTCPQHPSMLSSKHLQCWTTSLPGSNPWSKKNRRSRQPRPHATINPNAKVVVRKVLNKAAAIATSRAATKMRPRALKKAPNRKTKLKSRAKKNSRNNSVLTCGS